MIIEARKPSPILREALDALDEGFVLFDRALKLIFSNRSYAAMLGPHANLLVPGTAMQDIISRAVASGHVKILRGAEHGMPTFLTGLETLDRGKIEVLVSDGTQREIRLKRLSDGGLVANVKDITEQRTAEAQARDLLNKAINAVDLGIALIDDDDRLVFANQKYRDVADPAGEFLEPGVLLRETYARAIGAGTFPPPEGVTPAAMLAEVDKLIRTSAKGFSLVNDDGREIVGSVYETDLQGKLLTLEDVTDQLRAERLFTDAVNRLPVGVAIEEASGKLSHCNDAFAGPFGYSAEEFLKLSDDERFVTLAPMIASIAGEDVGKRGTELFGDAVRRQRETLHPFDVCFRNGRHFIVERAVTEGNRRVVVVTETTALKKSEERSLQTLNDTIQSLEEGLAVFDSDTGFLLDNLRWQDFFFDEIAAPREGEPLSSLWDRLVRAGVICVPPETAPGDYVAWLDHFARSLGQNETIRLRDGKILLASAHRTERDGYLLSFVDVTEQRRAEAEQREADLLLRKIVDACPANFLVSRIDDGKIIYCPPPSRERFGNISSTLSFFMNPEDRQKYLDALLPTGALDDYRVQFRRADGSVMQGITAARVTEYKGEQVIVSSTRDISDLLEMQEELQQQRDAAHQAEKLSALGELLAGVAHELNNPLSIIVGYAQMLEGRLEDKVLSRRVDRIAEAADRSARIVRAFLAMARQRPTKIEPCSLNDIVLAALDVAGYGMRSNGTEILSDLDDDLPLVSGDADQLVQVFSNLIINAEQALAPLGQGGRLIIRSFFDPARNQSVLEIRDNGPGIPEAIRARVFEPFFTTKDVGKGTGIGLAFSHRIIDAHGGRLDLETVEGSHTSFFVRLDVDKTGGRLEDGAQGKTAPTVQRRVLVVDDEETVGELICDMLEDLHCEPVMVTDAQMALDLLSHEPFDMVLSDFKMPGMNGAAFYEAILTDLPQYAERIGFVTGDALGEDVFRFLSKVGRPHVEKPILRDDLSSLLERLADQGENG
ncbi:Blue-light-activated protein [Roseovarius gaetbuli]|uniref:histidine kinase n=1 Tax=Roseovarius gaetbuli TaxID=1356575 RepID=A0A1X7ADB1_9RHOB|nr:PAS-domain containing protein [Roseovarius gaetbuli]SLN76229.1 Blue-light-activated protein [Roseovarius gaetbuli]